MIFHQRKLLLLPEPKGIDIKPKVPKPKDDDNKSKSLAPPQPQHHLQLEIILAAFFVGALLLCLACYVVRRSRRNKNPAQADEQSLVVTENDFVIDRLQGPEEDHHVWHIRTVGLPDSVINSIAEFTYKKRDEGLVGNGDCPVCLSEFEEDERLRMLPECGHAFHLACIDNWLRSHKSCPVCRAPVIVTLDGDTSNGSDEAGSSGSGFLDDEIGTEESGESRREFGVWSSKLRVVSDLGDYGRVRVMIHHQELVNKVRRSNSMS